MKNVKEIKVISVGTSERSSFKRCRRSWNWSSSSRGNLTARIEPVYFWLGSGIHFALEDFHGLKQYETPLSAWDAYVLATRECMKDGGRSIPDDWKDGDLLARGMMDYYLAWLKIRDPLKTYWEDGLPQCEVKFEIPVDIKPPRGYDKVVYAGTIDRVSIDDDGFLWLIDYKTAKTFRNGHLDTDQQISSYCWAASVIYDKPIGGFVYQQHKKIIPKPARILNDGSLSSAKQVTSWRLYNDAIVKLHGSVEDAPEKNRRYLNELAAQEAEERDYFIRRDRVSKNQHQIAAEGAKIIEELNDMLNPDGALYPNPTYMCGFCEFLDPCVALDSGHDWQNILLDQCTTRTDADVSWRQYLK